MDWDPSPTPHSFDLSLFYNLMIMIGQKLIRLYYFKFYINLALRPPYVRSMLLVSYLNYEFSMTTCIIAHSTVPSTRISRE